MNRRDALSALCFAYLAYFGKDANACIKLGPLTGLELRRDVAVQFAKAKYVVLVEMTVPHVLIRSTPPYAVAPATWTIRRVWKGPQAILGRRLIEKDLGPCSGMGEKGQLDIFYLERLGSDRVEPKFSGAAGSDDTPEHRSFLDALASGRVRVPSNPSLERP